MILTIKYSGPDGRVFRRYTRQQATRPFYFRLPLAIHFSLSLSLFFFNVRSALHAGEEWLMRHGVVWKKKASTLLFGRDFLFPRDSCFSLASSLFFPLPAPSTFFPLRSLFFPFLFHRIFALSTYVAGLILGVRVNSLHGIKVHSWRWCPAAKLPGCKVKKKKKERKKNHEKNACIW